ncbi:MAG: hypothetical protein J2P25_04465 [Nocardiopsaceae bacterium]|nr:hypothetical protein [Nocardiopsaceae bacterium]
MRHLLGFILAIVLAAAAFIGGSWGFMQLFTATLTMKAVPATGSGTSTSGPLGLPISSLMHDRHALLGLAALAGVALLAGLLVVTPRVSALAPGLPGLVLIAWTALYVVSVKRAVDLIPLKSHYFGTGWTVLLASGALGVAGIVMIIPLFVPSRWRRRRGDYAIDGTGGPSGLLADFDPSATRVE